MPTPERKKTLATTSRWSVQHDEAGSIMKSKQFRVSQCVCKTTAEEQSGRAMGKPPGKKRRNTRCIY